jgi:hypothetical protein
MSKQEKLRAQMIENANEINRLHGRIHETFSRRSEDADFDRQWSQACDDFHNRYGQLCIPGGWDSAFMDRLKAGEYYTVEAALCFLEVRPYFFRSGYMWKDLFRKCRRVPMNEEQSSRFIALLERHSEWRAKPDARAKLGMKVRNNLSVLFALFERLFPVYLRDSDLDEASTVGDLYGVLCRLLKVDALKEPEKSKGIARKPYSPGRFVRRPSIGLYTSDVHRRSSWNAADVWATLVAAIRQAYSLSNDFSITVKTKLPFDQGR